MKSKKLNPVVLILIILLLCTKTFLVVSMGGRVFQSGGKETPGALIADFEDAVNKGSVDDYMALLPRSERTKAERAYIKKHIEDYSGRDIEIEVVSTAESDQLDGMEQAVKLALLDPMFCPFITSTCLIKVDITDSGRTYPTYINAVKINGKYYLDDISY